MWYDGIVPTKKTGQPLYIRISEADRRLIEKAAAQEDMTVSDWVRRLAVRTAKKEIARIERDR